MAQWFRHKQGNTVSFLSILLMLNDLSDGYQLGCLLRRNRRRNDIPVSWFDLFLYFLIVWLVWLMTRSSMTSN
jgi:hypothetical protein